VRAAGPGDAEAIATVHARSWQDAYQGILTDEEIASRSLQDGIRKWREKLADPALQVSVAQIAGEVVGFVSAGPARDDDAPPATGEIGALYLVARAWDLGIGKKLMEVATGCLASKGYGDAVLWVLRDNVRARGFYERLGWGDDGGRKDCFGGMSAPAVRYRQGLQIAAGEDPDAAGQDRRDVQDHPGTDQGAPGTGAAEWA
jgi:GNAT superfamily N-acetyltransferase